MRVRSRHENGVVCMSVALAKSFVCNGVSTDTRFVSNPALVASAYELYPATWLTLNFIMSIMMIRLTPVAKWDLACTSRMSGHLTWSPQRRLLEGPRSGRRVHRMRSG